MPFHEQLQQCCLFELPDIPHMKGAQVVSISYEMIDPVASINGKRRVKELVSDLFAIISNSRFGWTGNWMHSLFGSSFVCDIVFHKCICKK